MLSSSSFRRISRNISIANCPVLTKILCTQNLILQSSWISRFSCCCTSRSCGYCAWTWPATESAASFPWQTHISSKFNKAGFWWLATLCIPWKYVFASRIHHLIWSLGSWLGILLGTMVNLRMTIRLLICLITKPVALQIRQGFPPLRPNRKAAKVAITSAGQTLGLILRLLVKILGLCWAFLPLPPNVLNVPLDRYRHYNFHLWRARQKMVYPSQRIHHFYLGCSNALVGTLKVVWVGYPSAIGHIWLNVWGIQLVRFLKLHMPNVYAFARLVSGRNGIWWLLLLAGVCVCLLWKRFLLRHLRRTLAYCGSVGKLFKFWVQCLLKSHPWGHFAQCSLLRGHAMSTSIAWPQWSFMVESLQDQLIWWSRDSNPLQGPVVGLTRPEMSLAIFSMTTTLASKDAWVPKSMTVDQSAKKPGSARGFSMRQLDFGRCSLWRECCTCPPRSRAHIFTFWSCWQNQRRSVLSVAHTKVFSASTSRSRSSVNFVKFSNASSVVWASGDVSSMLSTDVHRSHFGTLLTSHCEIRTVASPLQTPLLILSLGLLHLEWKIF